MINRTLDDQKTKKQMTTVIVGLIGLTIGLVIVVSMVA